MWFCSAIIAYIHDDKPREFLFFVHPAKRCFDHILDLGQVGDIGIRKREIFCASSAICI